MPNRKSHATPIDETLLVDDVAARVEKVLAPKYQEALERQRVFLIEQQTKLGPICARVKAGDRQSMLDLIKLTSDTLCAFDTLPEELRVTLADGLKTVAVSLSRSPDFPSGKLSALKRRKEKGAAFFTALKVEHERYLTGSTLENARASAADELQIGESLVTKRWKLGHKDAKDVIKMLQCIDEITGRLPTLRNKKVR